MIKQDKRKEMSCCPKTNIQSYREWDCDEKLPRGGRYSDKYENCGDQRKRLTSLSDDPCYIDCKSNTQRAEFGFRIENFRKKKCNPRDLCYPGYLPRDGEGFAQCDIDTDTDLRYSRLTRVGNPQQLRGLPIHVPFMGNGCLDTDTESQLRSVDTFTSNVCQPRDSSFHNRTFDIFDHMCFNPNAVKNTVWDGSVIGEDTRNDYSDNYQECKTNGKLNKKFFKKRGNTYDPSMYQGNAGVNGYDCKKPSNCVKTMNCLPQKEVYEFNKKINQRKWC